MYSSFLSRKLSLLYITNQLFFILESVVRKKILNKKIYHICGDTHEGNDYKKLITFVFQKETVK